GLSQKDVREDIPWTEAAIVGDHADLPIRWIDRQPREELVGARGVVVHADGRVEARTARGRARELDVAHVPIRLLENDVHVPAVGPAAPIDGNRREIEDRGEAQGRVESRLYELRDPSLRRDGRSLVDRLP